MKDNPVNYIPNEQSTGASWIEYHKVLKANFGKEVANQVWMKTWQQRGVSKADTRALREYLQTQNIDLDTSFSKQALDVPLNIIDRVQGNLKTTKTLTIGFLVAVGGIVLLLLYNIAKQPVEVAKAGAEVYAGSKGVGGGPQMYAIQ